MMADWTTVDRGATLVEVAVAAALIAACATLIGTGLDLMSSVGERALRAEATRRAVETEVALWPSTLLHLCGDDAATVLDAAPLDVPFAGPPAIWSVDGGWVDLPSLDCDLLDLSGPTVLRWTLQTPAGGSLEIVTRGLWP